MKPDHYATLGVLPTSEDVVVRAAYRALILRYHPDRNSSAEAARRTQAINAAYAVLGDAELRADYDAWRRGDGLEVRRRLPHGPIIAGSISAVAVGLLLFAILSPPAVPRQSGGVAASPAEGRALPDDLRPQFLQGPAIPAEQPETRLAAADLPELPDADAAIAKSAVAPAPPPTKAPVERTRERLSSRVAAAPRTAPAEAAPPAAAPAARPSFDCRFASGRAESAVCRNAELALLDERMAVLYSQSWGQADEAKRGQLLQTRDGFVERRNRCRSSSCLSETYLRRMREISDIMGRRGQPR